MKIPSGSDGAIARAIAEGIAGAVKGAGGATAAPAADAPANAPAGPSGADPWKGSAGGAEVLRGGANDRLVGGTEFAAATPAGAAAASYSGPPILGKYQAARAAEAWENLNGADKQTFGWLLGRAGSKEGEQYLHKALAAGHSMAEIEKFADQIRGKSAQWMRDNLRVTADADGGSGLAQQWNASCAPTTAEVVRAEMDPVYALGLHQRNADLHQVSPNVPKTAADMVALSQAARTGKLPGNMDVAVEQMRILEANGGDAVERGRKGGEGMYMKPALDSVSQWTGFKFKKHDVASVTARDAPGGVFGQAVNHIEDQKLKKAFDELDADLAKGLPGALSISNAEHKGGHAVAVTGVTGSGANKAYILHDPWEGKTVYVNADELRRGKVVPPVAGWPEVNGVYTPKD